jgi:hypothetical protein
MNANRETNDHTSKFFTRPENLHQIKSSHPAPNGPTRAQRTDGRCPVSQSTIANQNSKIPRDLSAPISGSNTF